MTKAAAETVKREIINTCGLPSSEQKRGFMNQGFDDVNRTSMMLDPGKCRKTFHSSFLGSSSLPFVAALV